MVDMATIEGLCKRRGFIYRSSEIYGGFNGFFDYGPLGVELKNNIKRAWWNDFVHGRDDIVGLDASIIMHPDVWRASGHVATGAPSRSPRSSTTSSLSQSPPVR